MARIYTEEELEELVNQPLHFHTLRRFPSDTNQSPITTTNNISNSNNNITTTADNDTNTNNENTDNESLSEYGGSQLSIDSYELGNAEENADDVEALEIAMRAINTDEHEIDDEVSESGEVIAEGVWRNKQGNKYI